MYLWHKVSFLNAIVATDLIFGMFPEFGMHEIIIVVVLMVAENLKYETI
jgi:hypothetical protein